MSELSPKVRRDALESNAGSQSAPVSRKMSWSRNLEKSAGATCAHLCYSRHRFCDHVNGPRGLKGLAWGVNRFLVASTNAFEVS